MSDRRPSRSTLGQPALIGGLAILVISIAVYLSYSANNGLPFVPSYRFEIDVPSAGHLTKNAAVTMGGTRVGRVSQITAIPHPDGPATARLQLALEDSVRELPADTRFRVRPVSNVGLDVVEVLRGRSRQTIRPDSTVPIARALDDVVPLDEFLDTFDTRARAGIQGSVQGFAGGFAGRGAGLNQTLAGLVPLLTDLAPVARNLTSQPTQLPRALDAFADLATELAPVAREQAQTFAELDDTFSGLGKDPAALERDIVVTPAAEEAVIAGAPASAAFLASAGRLTQALGPAARALPAATAPLSSALRASRAGLPALTRALPRTDRLTRELADVAQDPAVRPGLARVAETGRALAGLASFLAPAQTVCGYGGLLLRNLASTLSEGPATGTATRIVLVAVNAAPDSEAVLASAPSQGPDGQALGHLHANPYPNTAAPGQPRECEAGQEPFAAGRTVIGNVPGDQDAVTEAVTKP